MRRSLLAGGGVVAVILAIALLVRRCEAPETAVPAEPVASAPAQAPTAPAATTAAPAPPVAVVEPQQMVAQPAKTADLRDPALFDAARAYERELLAGLPETRTRLFSAFGDDGFAALMDALEVQMANDEGARELAALLAARARGRVPADGSVQLQSLHCGVRICAAQFLAANPRETLPSLGGEAVSMGHPLPNGGMRHRLVFALDPGLRLSPQPGRG